MEQKCFLSHWLKYRGSCAHLRGITELVRLAECNGCVACHLSSRHLSRESLTENELILVRASVLIRIAVSKGQWYVHMPKASPYFEEILEKAEAMSVSHVPWSQKALKSRDGKQVLLLRNNVAQSICNLPPPPPSRLCSLSRNKSYRESRGHPYVGYIGMCGLNGYGFQPFWS